MKQLIPSLVSVSISCAVRQVTSHGRPWEDNTLNRLLSLFDVIALVLPGFHVENCSELAFNDIIICCHSITPTAQRHQQWLIRILQNSQMSIKSIELTGLELGLFYHIYCYCPNFWWISGYCTHVKFPCLPIVIKPYLRCTLFFLKVPMFSKCAAIALSLIDLPCS